MTVKLEPSKVVPQEMSGTCSEKGAGRTRERMRSQGNPARELQSL